MKFQIILVQKSGLEEDYWLDVSSLGFEGLTEMIRGLKEEMGYEIHDSVNLPLEPCLQEDWSTVLELRELSRKYSPSVIECFYKYFGKERLFEFKRLYQGLYDSKAEYGEEMVRTVCKGSIPELLYQYMDFSKLVNDFEEEGILTMGSESPYPVFLDSCLDLPVGENHHH